MASAPWPRLVSMKWASGTPMQIERQMAHQEPNSGATCITRRPLPVANGTLFHRRESADPAESVKCSLFRDSDGSSWVEHAREPAGASRPHINLCASAVSLPIRKTLNCLAGTCRAGQGGHVVP